MGTLVSRSVSILDASGPLPDAVLRYDERPDALVDVFLPDGPADTVVTFVHGGFWRAAYDRTHVRPLARALGGRRLRGDPAGVPPGRRRRRLADHL